MESQANPHHKIIGVDIRPAYRTTWRAKVTVDIGRGWCRTMVMDFGRYPVLEDIRRAATHGRVASEGKISEWGRGVASHHVTDFDTSIMSS